MVDITKIPLLKNLGELDDRNLTLSKLSGGVSKSFMQERKLPVKDQKDTMMCVGFSHSALLENLFGLDNQLSQYMIYHNRNLSKFDEFPFPGWYNNLAEKHLQEEGVCLISSYDNFKEVPDAIFDFLKVKDTLLEEASEYKIKAYYQLNSVEEMKQFVASQNTDTQAAGVVLSIAVYENFGSIGSDGIFPHSAGKICGYHSICVLGCDDKYITVLNSVSDKWGDNGKGYISVEDTDVIQEIRGIVINKKEESIVPPVEQVSVLYRVQLSACRKKENAIADQEELAKKKLTKAQKNELGIMNDYLGSCLIYENGYYKCQVGSFAKKENAIKLQGVLQQLGYEDAWITKYTK